MTTVDIKTTRTEIKKILLTLMVNMDPEDEWAASLYRILVMVMNGGCNEHVTLVLVPEELKVWHEYTTKALL